MGALFGKRCLDNAKGFFSRRLCCTQVVTCKVAAILIKKGLFRARFGNIFRGRKKTKKTVCRRDFSAETKKIDRKDILFPPKSESGKTAIAIIFLAEKIGGAKKIVFCRRKVAIKKVFLSCFLTQKRGKSGLCIKYSRWRRERDGVGMDLLSRSDGRAKKTYFIAAPTMT